MRNRLADHKRKVFWILCLTPACSFASIAGPQNPAPPLELATLTGTKVSLSQFKGQVVLLNFWASWCAPCHEEFPRLNRLAADYAGQPVQVLAISVDEQDSNVQKFISRNVKNNLSLSVLRDPQGKIAGLYQVDAMPKSFIVDQNGVIRHTHSGFHEGDEKNWRQEIDALRANP